MNIKKHKKALTSDASKRLAPGEARALRKRIVLTNNNALEVRGLEDLSAGNALKAANLGQMRGIPDDAVDALRAVDAFKPRQGWNLFWRPAVLMRKETIQLSELFTEVENATKEQTKKTVRRVVFGDGLSGKSTLLLQGITMGFLRKWTIVNLPDAHDIVNAHTEYAPLPGSQPTQYVQNTYTSTLLSQILKANTQFFENTKVSMNHSLPVPLSSTSTLKQLTQLGVADPEVSWSIFVALWKELTQPGRPPIIFAIDGLQHIMRDSEYLSAEVKPIHAHDLAIIRHFINYLSGTETLTNGGLVLAATSGAKSPPNYALDYSIKSALARQESPEHLPLWDPYQKADLRIVEALKDVDVLKVSNLSKEEARSIMEYYAQSGMLRAKVDHKLVTEKWSLAGMGNIGELERVTVRMRA